MAATNLKKIKSWPRAGFDKIYYFFTCPTEAEYYLPETKMFQV